MKSKMAHLEQINKDRGHSRRGFVVECGDSTPLLTARLDASPESAGRYGLFQTGLLLLSLCGHSFFELL